MTILLRKLGQHRGAPRLYLDTPDLAGAGLLPGVGLRLHVDVQGCCVTLTADPTGTRKVSGKSRDRRQLQVIDINSAADLGIFEPLAVVRIVITATTVHVRLPGSLAKARLRHLRLQAKLARGQRLTLAGTAFGAGVASRALHEGLAAAGVPCDLVLSNEICEAYLDLAQTGNPSLTPRTALAAVPMQEAAADDRLLRDVGRVDILEAGIPWSGASKAGVSKRGLTRIETIPRSATSWER